MMHTARAMQVTGLLANYKPDFRAGPRKWKVRKLRGSRPARIVLYAPFYLGEVGRFATFAAAIDTVALIERRAKDVRDHG